MKRFQEKGEKLMFKKWKDQIKRVPSYQYKNNLITSLICWSVLLVFFIPLVIYCFSLKNLWYLAFIPLFIIATMSLIWGIGIRWLWKQYRQTLSNEKEANHDNEEKICKK